MIRICIDFYDKKTRQGIRDATVLIPEDIVFKAVEEDEFTDDEFSKARAEEKHIDYINCRPFAVSEGMKKFIIDTYPETKEYFDIYLYDFIGRHGLGPEYD